MPQKYAVKGGLIFDGITFIENKSIIINGSRIENIVEKGEHAGLEEVNAEGLIISPGFIDMQLNGCGGVLLNDDISEKTLKKMHETNVKYGCTSFMPTLITTTYEEIKKAVNVAKSFYKKNKYVITGIHIEGPYISTAKKGAHNPAHIKPIDSNMVDFLCESVNEIPIVITMAPENNSTALINKLACAGVKVSLGHSNATYEEAMLGINAGACMATHLFNAMSAFESRKPGLVGAVFDSDIHAGIIVDGHHSSFASVRVAKKIMRDRLYIVTDAVTPMGTDIKEFYLADQKVFVENGQCINESGSLAGSNIDMLSSLKNAVEKVGIGIEEAIRMVTLYPAKHMGIELEAGVIRKNATANLAIFSKDFNMHYTVDRGTLIKLD